MGKKILVTGGARSGKSTFGEKLLKEKSGVKGYIATAIAFDQGMQERIQKHQEQRPKTWKTYELPYSVSDQLEIINRECDHILLDCVTVLTSNILLNEKCDWEEVSFEKINSIEEKIIAEIEAILEGIEQLPLDIILISNEVGSGIVPERRLGRLYRDIAGRVNQVIAKRCDKVYTTIAGIPLQIK